MSRPERALVFPFPGISATADGAAVAVWVETQVTEAACGYPITPSTMMAVPSAVPGIPGYFAFEATGLLAFSRTRLAGAIQEASLSGIHEL